MIEAKPNENKELSLKEKVDTTYDFINSLSEKDKKRLERKMTKNLKIPRKAKVSKSRMKKGWIGVLFLTENKNIRAEKTKVEGGTYILKDGNTRYMEEDNLCFWEGKYPIIFQRYDKANPQKIDFINPFDGTPKVNEVFGQDQIKLRIKRDLIKDKPKGNMSILVIIAILVGGYFLIKTFFPKLFGG